MSINQYLFSRDFISDTHAIQFEIDFTNCNHNKSRHYLG